MHCVHGTTTDSETVIYVPLPRDVEPLANTPYSLQPGRSILFTVNVILSFSSVPKDDICLSTMFPFSLIIVIWTIAMSLSVPVNARHHPTDSDSCCCCCCDHHRPSLLPVNNTKQRNPTAPTDQHLPRPTGLTPSPFSSFLPTPAVSTQKMSLLLLQKHIRPFLRECTAPVCSSKTTKKTTTKLPIRRRTVVSSAKRLLLLLLLHKKRVDRPIVDTMIERQGGVVFRQFRGGGGGGTIRDASLPRPKNVLVSLVVTLQSRILDLNRFVGNDPKRCWTVLLAAIVLDTVSTVTMKRAQQKQSLALLLSAYTGYFLRYVFSVNEDKVLTDNKKMQDRKEQGSDPLPKMTRTTTIKNGNHGREERKEKKKRRINNNRKIIRVDQNTTRPLSCCTCFTHHYLACLVVFLVFPVWSWQYKPLTSAWHMRSGQPWEQLSYRPSGSSGLVNEMMQPKYYVYP